MILCLRAEMKWGQCSAIIKITLRYRKSWSDHQDGYWVVNGWGVYTAWRCWQRDDSQPGMEWGGVSFHHFMQNGAQLKTYELFISGTFHVIFSDYGWWNHGRGNHRWGGLLLYYFKVSIPKQVVISILFSSWRKRASSSKMPICARWTI